MDIRKTGDMSLVQKYIHRVKEHKPHGVRVYDVMGVREHGFGDKALDAALLWDPLRPMLCVYTVKRCL